MVVDVHSHFWRPGDFSEEFRSQVRRARDGEIDLTVRWEDYIASAENLAKTIVFGGKARLSGIWVPDDVVAAYVSQHADKLVGFLSLDPTQPGWQEELRRGHQDLRLKGIKLMPMYAGFSPHQRELDYLWEYAGKHNLPV